MLVQFRKADKPNDVIAVYDMEQVPRIGEHVHLTGLVTWKVTDVIWRAGMPGTVTVPVIVMLG